MFSGALCPTYDLSNLHFNLVTAQDNDVFNVVPVIVPGMHLSVVHVTVLEGIFDGKTLFRA